METNFNQTTAHRPEKVTAIAVLSILNGLISVFWGIIASIGVAATIIGLCCIPITILPIILGGFEIAYAIRLLSDPPRPCTPNKTIAILDIINIIFGNFISLVIGILLLVFYSDNDTKEWFKTLCKEDEIIDLEPLQLPDSDPIN